jgi:hypothetical protein
MWITLPGRLAGRLIIRGTALALTTGTTLAAGAGSALSIAPSGGGRDVRPSYVPLWPQTSGGEGAERRRRLSDRPPPTRRCGRGHTSPDGIRAA